MRTFTVTTLSALLLSFGGASLEGGTIDVTSDCLGPCTSITYSGAPGATSSGTSVPLIVNGVWTSMAAQGLSGQWISYAQTGLTGTGPAAGQLVTFTVNYSISPLFNISGVTLNVLADDFTQMTASPQNFGPLPLVWDPLYIPGVKCSENPPGCIPTTLYTYTLDASQRTMFGSDNQLTFTVIQLVDSTPFGLAFDMKVTGSFPGGVPEPGTLSLLALGLAAGSTVAWRRRRRL